MREAAGISTACGPEDGISYHLQAYRLPLWRAMIRQSNDGFWQYFEG